MIQNPLYDMDPMTVAKDEEAAPEDVKPWEKLRQRQQQITSRLMQPA